jgi:hypothetical protein
MTEWGKFVPEAEARGATQVLSKAGRASAVWPIGTSAGQLVVGRGSPGCSLERYRASTSAIV